MEIIKTSLDGVKLIRPAVAFEDHRGLIFEHYNSINYGEAGIGWFVQDTISVSYRGVIRGIHGDDCTTKIVSCLHGRIYTVAVNNLKGHPQFLKWETFVLTGDNRLQLLVPIGFGNGYQVLSDMAIYYYKLSVRYGGQDKQFSINPFDPKLGIPWPLRPPILSKRDMEAPYL